jgi:hypothetical protein
MARREVGSVEELFGELLPVAPQRVERGEAQR